MKTWSTKIYAICPIEKEQKTFVGPNIKAFTRNLAHEYCQNNGLGYCHVSDELIAEIPCNTSAKEADFNREINYEDKSQDN